RPGAKERALSESDGVRDSNAPRCPQPAPASGTLELHSKTICALCPGVWTPGGLGGCAGAVQEGSRGRRVYKYGYDDEHEDEYKDEYEDQYVYSNNARNTGELAQRRRD